MNSELNDYKANGFLIAKGLLDNKSIEKICSSIAKTFLNQLHESRQCGC